MTSIKFQLTCSQKDGSAQKNSSDIGYSIVQETIKENLLGKKKRTIKENDITYIPKL